MSWMTISNASALFVLRWFRVRLVTFAPRVCLGPEAGVEFSGTHPAKGSWKVTSWISRDDSSGIEPSNGQPFRCTNQILLPAGLAAVKLSAPPSAVTRRSGLMSVGHLYPPARQVSRVGCSVQTAGSLAQGARRPAKSREDPVPCQLLAEWR